MTDANPARARKSHSYAREEGDHYVEPLWLGEGLFRWLLLPAGTVVLDPPAVGPDAAGPKQGLRASAPTSRRDGTSLPTARRRRAQSHFTSC